MRGLRSLALVSHSSSSLVPVYSASSRACIFCQFGSQNSRRNLSSTSCFRAQGRTDTAETASQIELARDSIAADADPSKQGLPAREPEFEFEIDPEPPQSHSSSAADGSPTATRRTSKPRMMKHPEIRADQLRRAEENRRRKAAYRMEKAEKEAEKEAAQASIYQQQERMIAMQKTIDEGESDYVQAETEEGLHEVGADYPVVATNEFEPFAMSRSHGPSALQDGSILSKQLYTTAAVYRALVETYLTLLNPNEKTDWDNYRPATLFNATRFAKIEVIAPKEGAASGSLQLTYPSKAIEAEVLRTTNATEPFNERDLITDNAAADEIIRSWGRSWLHVPIEDPTIKFGIIKRLTYLLGQRIPDHIIHKSKTVFILLSHIARPDPPAKVYEALTRRKEPKADLSGVKRVKQPGPQLLDLPNVRVSRRRQNSVDKENELGRWKVIEHELERRGLPSGPERVYRHG